MKKLHTNCLPVLVGSLPINDHTTAMEMILEYTPQIPIWPQLPVYPAEGMVSQFIAGLPGVDECDGTTFINSQRDDFETDFLRFYEEYLMITEESGALDESRFVLSQDAAQGFFAFLQKTSAAQDNFTALKAQTTGPFTFATSVVDQDNRAIFYNDQLKDAAVKLLALKARWQIQKMKEICTHTIMVFDEPALAGFGSSAFITISKEDVAVCFTEVFEAVKQEGAIAGVHVCANTEWSVLFEAGAELVSFDAYSYFDKLILYPEHLRIFFAGGGILASGIIPTTPESIDKENVVSLMEKWLEQKAELEKIGIPKEQILKQTLITPSCGTGSISPEYANKVMKLTNELSGALRHKFALS